MNYETYKRMTKAQKEEYDYKFRNEKPHINIKGLMTTAVIFIMVANNFLFLSYLFMTGEHFTESRDQVDILFQLGMRVFQLISVILMIGFVYYSVRQLTFLFLERYWLKKNNIKIEKSKFLKTWKEKLKAIF